MRGYDAAMGEHRDIANLANSGLPRRVQDAASRLLHVATSELGERITTMLDQLDAQMFKQAEHARSASDQADLLKGVQALNTHRDQFAPAFFAALESRLSLLRTQATISNTAHAARPLPSSMWTVHDSIPEEESNRAFLRSLAVPVEGAANLPLYLLGQRFGVLAGAPAFTPEQMCVGPHMLIQLAGDTGGHVFHGLISKASLQSLFADTVLRDYAQFVERLNATLDQAGVLPGLTYVPVRPTKASNSTRPAPRDDADNPMLPDEDGPPPDDAAASNGATSSSASNSSHAAPAAPAPLPTDDITEWLSQPVQAPLIASAPPTDFRFLQQLLTARRIAGKVPARPAPPKDAELSHADIDQLLSELQSAPATTGQARSIRGIREDIVQRARTDHGPMAEMGREASDTFEIMSLLHAEIVREVRPGSSVHGLLERLQVPMLRLALRDKDFFELPSHPARQLLNTIAEADATAYGNNAADPYFEQAMHRAVERIETDFDGQPEVLDEVNEELQSEFRQQIKRSQASEKRLVAAARGRERMAIAQETAAAALDQLIAEHNPPQVVEALMRRAWVDAMTLTVLRHGEDSNAWLKKLDTTRKILETVNSTDPVESTALADDIDAEMRRVGYHEAEAASLASHLSRSPTAEPDIDVIPADALSERIQSHTRLGEEDDERKAEKLERGSRPPRNHAQEECYRHLRTIPFGTWLDFVLNQQGMIERRRLSWYSNVTDHALFVNRRGQRVAEIHMDSLARLMAQGQLRPVQEEEVRLIDRAFKSTVDALRSALRGNAKPSPFRPMSNER